DLRSLQLDIAITDGVENATSLFSIPLVNSQTGAFESFFPEFIENDDEAKTLIAKLLKQQPQAAALVVPEDNLAVIRISIKNELNDQESYQTFRSVKQEVVSLKPDDFEVLFTGITPLGLTIVEALVSDQMKLTLIGLVLGTGIALYVFRSLLAAIVCAVPPTITALWTIALFAVSDTPLNYLTTILPTLGLILAFADGIVLYYRWQRSNFENDDFVGNLKIAIKRVGPASALTSVTTALAFLSFSFASSAALKTFAYLGVGAVSAAFLAVIIGLPLAAHWAMALGAVKRGRVSKPVFEDLGKIVHRVVFPRPMIISVLAVFLVIGLGFIHNLIRPEYRITDYLPLNSDAKKAETIANEVLQGGSVLFVSIPVIDKNDIYGSLNRQKLASSEKALIKVFGPSRVLSINALFKQLNAQAAVDAVVEELIAAGDVVRSSYISKNNEAMLISILLPSNQSIVDTAVQVDEIKSALSKVGVDDPVISGLPVLMAEEFTTLIEQLRTSLLIAIGLGVLIIGVATRSPLMAIAAITPNLIPILMIELVIYMQGGAVNMSQVISLTVAFGIAIDNAVHVINVLDEARRNGLGIRDGIRSAMAEVGPALGASTLIICVATLVTQISVMPMVPTLGKLMITTLIIALISNLAILPANVLTMRELMPNLLGRKKMKGR
ncbi:MAG: MMPL family transporter, partial [Hyphomicrobiales bacterium]|nr:MMPL family transporter [Hyphomicrobiales bacterium]